MNAQFYEGRFFRSSLDQVSSTLEAGEEHLAGRGVPTLSSSIMLTNELLISEPWHHLGGK